MSCFYLVLSSSSSGSIKSHPHSVWRSSKLSHLWNFGIFHIFFVISKLICLVTMFDRKKVRWDFFCDFQTLWYPLFNVFNAVLRQKLKASRVRTFISGNVMLRQFRLKTWKLTSKNARTHNGVWRCCCPGKNTIILQVVLLICSILFFGKVEAINVKPYVDLVQG